MSEIVFRLPSKVPYGYAEVRYEMSQDGPPEPSILAALYANYVMAFAEAERAALDAYGKPEVPQTQSEENVHETAVQALSEGLGATVVDEEAPPWKKKVTAKSKAWQQDTKTDDSSGW